MSEDDYYTVARRINTTTLVLIPKDLKEIYSCAFQKMKKMFMYEKCFRGLN